MKQIKKFLITILLILFAVGILKMISMISFKTIFRWLENNWVGIIIGVLFSQVGDAIFSKITKNKE